MTAKEMQVGLRGGLSLEGRRYLLLELDVDICDRFEFTHDGGRSLHISRRPELIQVFFLSFGAYLMGKRRCTLARDPKAALVNDARLGEFPATHLEPYSQAADVCACRRISPAGAGEAWLRGYAGKASEKRSFQAKSSLPKKAKSVSFGGAGGIRTHGPRKANGFRVRLVMTTSILLHNEITSGDG